MTKYTKSFAESLKEVRKPKVVNEFKKMTVSFKSHDAMAKASTDLAKQGFTITGNKDALKVDGKGADLNKYATDLKNFYGATVKAESLEEDYEVSMAIGQLRTINEYATKLISILEAKGSDYNIEAWVQSKITTAEDYMNSVGHYMENNPEITNEAKEEEPGKDGKIGPAGKIALAKEKDTDALEAQIVDLKGRLALTMTKLENEKNKVVKPEPNPETGEVPLRTGIANAILDKKMDTKKLVQSKKKKEIKVGGKTAIEINPDKDIGNFSGGMRTNAGNLH
jgi:hypothetical protein